MSVFKNDVGRPSNKTIILRRILKVVCLLIIIVVSIFIGYNLKDNDKIDITDEKIEEKENSKENEQKKELDVNSSLVLDLFNNVNRFDNIFDALTDSSYLYNYFYTENKILDEEVLDVVKFAIVFDKKYYKEVQLLGDKYNDFKFYLSDINKESKEIFGNDIDVKNILDNNGNVIVSVKSNSFKYNTADESFSLVDAGVGDCSSTDLKTKILSAFEYKNKVEIVSKVMYIYSSTCDPEELKIFKSYDKNTFNLKDEIADLTNVSDSIKLENISINDYVDKLDTFKWIFTKNENGNYVFESVEKIG